MVTKKTPASGPKRRRKKSTKTISDLLLAMASLEERAAVYMAIVDFLGSATGDDFGDNPNQIVTDSGSPVSSEIVFTVMDEMQKAYGETEDRLNQLKDTEVEVNE